MAQLRLSNNLLTGTLPAAVFNLTSLLTLQLANNSFQGTLSDQVGQLRLLQTLDLSDNRLSGSLPPSIANATALHRHAAAGAAHVEGSDAQSAHRENERESKHTRGSRGC